MCVIIDACRLSAFFSDPCDPVYEPVWRWLFDDGILVYGGHQLVELGRVAAAQRTLARLKRAGKAQQVADALVSAEQKQARAVGKLRSNDDHILGLARASGARVLCTGDDALMQDFKNQQLVPRPRGKIYTAADHAHLLGHTKGCRQSKPERR